MTISRRRVRCALVAIALALVCQPLASPVAAQSELIGVEPSRTFRDVGGAVRAVAFSSAQNIAAVGSASGRVTVVDLATGTIRGRWDLHGQVGALAFTRASLHLAAGTSNGELALIDVGTGDSRVLAKSDPITALAFDPGGRVIAAGTRGGDIELWSATDGTRIGRLRDSHDKAVRLLAYLGVGASLLSVGDDRRLVYWDVKQLRALRQTTDVERELRGVAADPSGKLLALALETFTRGSFSQPNSYYDVLRIVDGVSGAPQKTIDLQSRTPGAVSLSPDYRYVATGLHDARSDRLTVWDVERGVSVVDLPADALITAMGFAPDGQHLLAGTEQGTVVSYSVSGVTPRVNAVADLQGLKYRITSSRAPLLRPTRRVRLAVFEFDDNGVGADVSRAIADQIDNRLADNRGVRLVERRRIATILGEQNLQHSGRTDAGTAVQLARILNVNKAVLGSVAKLGTTMTISVRLVDAQTAAIDGVREVQCQACSTEDLTYAVAELAQTLVAPSAPEMDSLPDPPSIDIEYPKEDLEVNGESVVVRGRVRYSRALQGLELIVNGEPVDASRLLPRDGKVTPISGANTVAFVQQVALTQPTNVIALRAIGGDENDEQRYITVRRRGGAVTPTNSVAPAAAAPGIAIAELESALISHVPFRRLIDLVGRFGIEFAWDASMAARLRRAGADDALVAACASAKRVPAG
jgi:WD40 repeat protein